MKLDNSILHICCRTVSFDNPKKNLDLAHKLLRLMKKSQGIGLAANQTGVDARVFVMHIDDKYYHCFNPAILAVSENLTTLDEGCLSFPGKECKISRPDKVVVKYFSAEGIEVVEELGGLAARCFQHELDHLNGITMFDL